MSKRYYLTELPDGNYKKADPKKVKEALKFEKKRKKLRRKRIELAKAMENCKHEVCYDEPGWIYDTRICVKCGHISLL